MKQKNVSSWYTGGDDQLLEVLMSITGSYAIAPLETKNDTTDGGGKRPRLTRIPPSALTISDLIEGGDKLSINTCIDGHDADECLVVEQKPTEIRGMSDYVLDLLLGTTTSTGLIAKLSTNTGTLTASEKNFLVNAPGGVGAMIRNLSVLQPGSAEMFAREAAGFIALDLVYVMISDMVSTARATTTDVDSSFIEDIQLMMRGANDQISMAKIELRNKYVSQRELYNMYTQIMSTARHKRYGMAFSSAGSDRSVGTK